MRNKWNALSMKSVDRTSLCQESFLISAAHSTSRCLCHQGLHQTPPRIENDKSFVLLCSFGCVGWNNFPGQTVLSNAQRCFCLNKHGSPQVLSFLIALKINCMFWNLHGKINSWTDRWEPFPKQCSRWQMRCTHVHSCSLTKEKNNQYNSKADTVLWTLKNLCNNMYFLPHNYAFAFRVSTHKFVSKRASS